MEPFSIFSGMGMANGLLLTC